MSRLQGPTGRSAFPLESPFDDMVVFDATLLTVVIGRSHSRGSRHAPFLLRYSCDSAHYFNQSDNIANTFLTLDSTVRTHTIPSYSLHMPPPR